MNRSTATKILFLAANPINSSRLRLDEEERSIRKTLKQARYRDQFELISQGAVRINDLSEALLEYKPQIVHFSGHGQGSPAGSDDRSSNDLSRDLLLRPEPSTSSTSGSEGLLLEDEQGRAKIVSTEALAGLFKSFRNDVRCVVLNACYSETQAAAIHQHIDCVVGMNKAIGDQAAIQFATEFYKALATGYSFSFAYQFALNNLDLNSIPESSTPVLQNRRAADDPFQMMTAMPDLEQKETVPASSAATAFKQSQTFGNITFSGSNNPFNAIQSAGSVTVTQTNGQTTGSNTELQTALTALVALKEQVAATDGLSSFTKKDTESKIGMLQDELQKPKPDRSLVNDLVEALKQGLSGVITLAAPVTQVVSLVAKAWVGQM